MAGTPALRPTAKRFSPILLQLNRRIADPGPGYCHFPMPDPEKPIAGAYDHEYFRGLTSEKVQTRFSKGHPIREWHKPPGARNEPLDRRAYALAVLYSRTIPWEILARSAPTEFNAAKEEVAPKLAPPPTQRAPFTRPIRGRFRGR